MSRSFQVTQEAAPVPLLKGRGRGEDGSLAETTPQLRCVSCAVSFSSLCPGPRHRAGGRSSIEPRRGPVLMARLGEERTAPPWGQTFSLGFP